MTGATEAVCPELDRGGDRGKLIDAYDELVDWALVVAQGEPFNARIDDESVDYARLTIHGDTVKLEWLDLEDDYDTGRRWNEREQAFPAYLLAVTAEELASFQQSCIQERRRRGKEEQIRKSAAWHAGRAAREARAEAAEKAELLRLKAKYEPSA